ncbi:Uncharacterised protein [Candidatus Tiddalikarchaeum anstoanum]|nr:Uncharacterised protein [Candidatus Tiddalikarchaeum anstoanum]
MYEELTKKLSRLYDKLFKNKVEPSRELIEACNYLELPYETPFNVAKASIVITAASAIILTLAFLTVLHNNISIPVIVAILSIPIIINHLYSDYYKEKYYFERVKDLGYLPDFFSIIITNLKIKPNLETALLNTIRFEYGKITRSAKKLINELRSGKKYDVKDALQNITKEFNNPSVNRAMSLILTSLSIKDSNRRRELLNMSLNQLLKGMVYESEKFSKKLYIPVLLLFSFGTILPLVIISVIPIISIIRGSSFNIYTIIFFFLLTLIITKIIVDGLKKKNPSRFSQIIIKKDEKGVSIILLMVLFLGISSPAIIYLMSIVLPYQLNFLQGYQTLFLYAALSLCFSLYFYSKSSALIKEKKKIEIFEHEMIDAFFNLGGRINEGRSVEDSLKYVSDVSSEGYAKKVFGEGYKKIKHGGFSLEQVFNKIHVMDRLYSQRIKGLSEVFVESAKRHSTTAGENIIELCNYYNSIYESEEEMTNSMSKNTDMIKLTMTLFAPMVCALVINMQRLIFQTITKTEILNIGFSPLNIENVQLVVSLYVFFLTLILNYFYSFVENNNEKISTNYNAFMNIIVSCAVFTATLIISRFLLF